MNEASISDADLSEGITPGVNEPGVPREALADEVNRPDRLTPAVAVGVMALLLLCAVLVLVAWNRATV